jgi:hypothetical protein
MADTVLNTTVFDGDKKLITHYNVISDGTGNTTKIVDVSALNTNKQGEACTTVRLNKVSCNVSATPAIRMLWDATTDVAFQTLQGEMEYDYSSFGGLKNTEATGFTGDVVINLPSTAVTGDTGTIVCEWIKNYD